MKNRTKLTILAGLALVSVGIWFGRVAWRAHHRLVTLNVRDESLGRVIRTLEWQTWETIQVDSGLRTAKVTLTVNQKPLADVLDMLCDQTGARWSETFAVYNSRRALTQLGKALQGEVQIAEAGWTNLTPAVSEPVSHGSVGHGAGSGGNASMHRAVMQGQPDGSTKMAMFTPSGEVKVTQQFPDGTSKELNSNSEPRLTRGLTEGDSGGPMGDGWSPAQLVLDKSLVAKLGSTAALRATPDSAKGVAARVHGKWTTCYALQTSPWRAVIRAPRFLSAKSAGARKPANSEQTGSTNAPGSVQQELARQAAVNELQLTPEQQVQRAQERKTRRQGMAGAHGAQN
jgi:hypothetical protein